jgi:signal transduction histidine kinase
MMSDFLANNRGELIQRCRTKVAQRPLRHATAEQLREGVPTFLDQLIKTLRIEQSSDSTDSREISGLSSGVPSLSEIGQSAAHHGRNLLALGFSVDQVVHDYGDLCQAITDLAFERDAPFLVDEFRTLNRCLDNAIADAVTEFSYQRDLALRGEKRVEVNERLGFFAHELRNLLGTANLAFAATQAGGLSLSGATGSVLERSLESLTRLVDQSIDEVGTEANNEHQDALFSLSDFVADVRQSSDLAAKLSGIAVRVSAVDVRLGVSGNRDLLYSSVMNLLQNAFKFTKSHTAVTLDAYADADRILIDVKDHCGGLPPGDLERLFEPSVQTGANGSGIGLGLSVARRSIESNGGVLSVRDEPGRGCTFTISLPRHTMSIN